MSRKRPQVTIDDVHAVYRSSKRVTEKQLDTLERELGAELPRGYREFLTRVTVQPSITSFGPGRPAR